MSSEDNGIIYIDDADVPATLLYMGRAITYGTLREAISAWYALSSLQNETSIKVEGDLYRPWEIRRIQYRKKEK